MSFTERAKAIKGLQLGWANRAGDEVSGAATAPTKTARPRQSYNADEDNEGHDVSEPNSLHTAPGAARSRAPLVPADEEDEEEDDLLPAANPSRVASTQLFGIDEEEADPRPTAVSRKASGASSSRAASAPALKAGEAGEEVGPRPAAKPRKASFTQLPAAHPSLPASARFSSIDEEADPRPSAVSRKASRVPSSRAPSEPVDETNEEAADFRLAMNPRRALGSGHAANRTSSTQLHKIKDEVDHRIANARKTKPPSDSEVIIIDDDSDNALSPTKAFEKPSRASSAQAIDVDAYESDHSSAPPRRIASGTASGRSASRAPPAHMFKIKDEEVEHAVAMPRKNPMPRNADVIFIDDDDSDDAPAVKGLPEPSTAPKTRESSGAAAPVPSKESANKAPAPDHPSGSVVPTAPEKSNQPSTAQSRASSKQSGEGSEDEQNPSDPKATRYPV
ncbi:hypothetical protein BOTBODRAFT_182555, partial [Botryobasidium botryosum FD-172 SS1]